MTENAGEAFNRMRAEFNDDDTRDQAREAFEARMKLITDKAGGALDLALKGDLLQVEEIERLRNAGSTLPYEFSFYVQSSDSDEELGFDEDIVVSKTISIRLAANPSSPKEGNELVLYFPVSDDFMLEADTQFKDLPPINEFYALKKVKHPSGDYDTYMHFSPRGVRAIPQPSRKIKDQIKDFRLFMANVNPDDFTDLDYTRNDVDQMRRDLRHMELVWHKRSVI